MRKEVADGAAAHSWRAASLVGQQPAGASSNIITFSQADEDWTAGNQQAELTGSICSAVAHHRQPQLQKITVLLWDFPVACYYSLDYVANTNTQRKV